MSCTVDDRVVIRAMIRIGRGCFDQRDCDDGPGDGDIGNAATGLLGSYGLQEFEQTFDAQPTAEQDHAQEHKCVDSILPEGGRKTTDENADKIANPPIGSTGPPLTRLGHVPPPPTTAVRRSGEIL